MEEFVDWSIDEAEILDIKLVDARDIFVDFYYSVRKAAKDVLDEETMLPSEDDRGYEHAKEEIATMIDLAGGNYEKPKKMFLEALIPILLEKVASWGVPEAVIGHYRKELNKVVAAIE